MISILPALAGIIVFNFENDLTQKYAHHVSYDVYPYSPRNSRIFKSVVKCRSMPAESRRKFADLDKN